MHVTLPVVLLKSDNGGRPGGEVRTAAPKERMALRPLSRMVPERKALAASLDNSADQRLIVMTQSTRPNARTRP